jgi:hypothetical protein
MRIAGAAIDSQICPFWMHKADELTAYGTGHPSTPDVSIWPDDAVRSWFLHWLTVANTCLASTHGSKGVEMEQAAASDEARIRWRDKPRRGRKEENEMVRHRGVDDDDVRSDL